MLILKNIDCNIFKCGECFKNFDVNPNLRSFLIVMQRLEFESNLGLAKASKPPKYNGFPPRRSTQMREHLFKLRFPSIEFWRPYWGVR